MKKTAQTVSAILLAGILTTACGEPQDPCQINPTYQAADGEWREADGEPLDNDPCDSDDLNKSGHKVKKPVKKTTRKS